MRKFLCALVFSAALLLGCGGGGGSNTAQLPPVADMPTISISAAPTTINQGESTTITWTTTNADRVEISGIPDATSPSGVVTVTPLATTAYVITAYGVKTAAAQVVVTVITVIVPPPPPPPPPPVISTRITAQWTLPTTYTDGTAIASAEVSKLVVTLYMNTVNSFTGISIPVATSMPGASSVIFGPVDVTSGVTYYFTCKATTSTGEVSDFAPAFVHIWN